ncbi:hypothetical protein [Chryseobacterium jejuense]|uniref:hypothetical protein n=1 Tax=Chryseobacterium jejuense TaxID=445960 RepID=UPI001AEB543D|nr:hypothetical protein [Chryseobacterium jejuense]MBP2619371.1 c-di-AMP phosphodiesterase-like protein [Chryseobacterium jejuense]
MEEFKHVKREGTEYFVKQYLSLQHIIVIAWLLISIIVLVNTSYLKTGIIMLIFSLLLTIVSFMPPSVCFDPVSKCLTLLNRGLNRRKFIYDLNDFEGFELRTMYIGIIPLGCYLYGNFKNVSHFKRPVISQSFTKKTMQEVVNELEDLNIKHNTIPI